VEKPDEPGGTRFMPDRIRLDGKVAVVTGAAGVIGTATIQL
jgi:NADPH:quinone reductase-like Zn-dependent oxidoreductase